MATPPRSRWLLFSLAGLLVVAVALLVQVSLGKRAAEESWNDLYELAVLPRAGMYVPIYVALASTGDSVRLGEPPDGRRQLLYFFTTTCRYCRASIPAWKAIAERSLSMSDVDVLGVAVDSSSALSAYVEEHDLPYPVVRMADARYARLFRASAVPLTMVVDPGGRVVYARRGEFSSAVPADSVMAALHAPLPDPREFAPAPSVGSVRGSR